VFLSNKCKATVTIVALKFTEAYLGKNNIRKYFLTTKIGSAGTDCPRTMWSLPPWRTARKAPANRQQHRFESPSTCQGKGEASVIAQDSSLF